MRNPPEHRDHTLSLAPLSVHELIAPYGGTLVDLLPAQPEQRRELQSRAALLPSIQLAPRALCDLELLITGGFSPLNRFMGSRDYHSVLASMRLADGTLFPIPITLPIDEGTRLALDHDVVLRDQRNNMIAIMRVEERFRRDLDAECLAVAGTRDPAHPLVAEMANWGSEAISGRLTGITLPRHVSFIDLRLSPDQVRSRLAALGNRNVVAFQTRNPLHRAHEELTKRAGLEVRATLLLHPVVGLTKPGDIDVHTRVRCYRELTKHYFDQSRTMLSVLPLAMRMAGPREAIWHALIRRNYGASHFIVGRDHAGPGRDSSGRPFYSPTAAQALAKSHERDLGVTILPYEEMVYREDTDQYVPASQAQGPGVRRLSGTEVREHYLDAGHRLPDWFTRPHVARILQEMHVPRFRQGVCIWFTGLSGAGKTTIAEVLVEFLVAHGRQVTLLDGDAVRTHLSRGLGFSRADRDANVLRIGFVAAEIVRHHGIAVCAAVSPYETTRQQVREMVGPERFVLVHVNTSLEVCKSRDVKGLYARAHRGEIKGVTGIDDPYETPSTPDLEFDAGQGDAIDYARDVVSALKSRGYLRSLEPVVGLGGPS